MSKKFLLVPLSIFFMQSPYAAEIYNKDRNKLDLNGRVKAMHYISDDKNSDGDQSYARLGFLGETQINDQLTGYGRWEYEFNASNSEGGTDNAGADGNKTRFAFAGLKFGNFGSFDYGRNYGVVYDALAWVDVLPEFGAENTYNDNFFVGRGTGFATYRNTDMFGLVDGLNFTLQYQGKNDRTEDSGRRANGDGWGGAITYETPFGLGVSGAYASADRTDNQQNSTYGGGGERAEQWATSVKYDQYGLYLAASYAETRNATYLTNNSTDQNGFANKTQDILLVAQYKFDFGFVPSLAYTKSKAKDVEGIGDVDLIEYVEIGGTYYFNKNTSVFVDYIINQIDSDNALGLPDDDKVALGITYQF